MQPLCVGDTGAGDLEIDISRCKRAELKDKWFFPFQSVHNYNKIEQGVWCGRLRGHSIQFQSVFNVVCSNPLDYLQLLFPLLPDL